MRHRIINPLFIVDRGKEARVERAKKRSEEYWAMDFMGMYESENEGGQDVQEQELVLVDEIGGTISLLKRNRNVMWANFFIKQDYTFNIFEKIL